MKTYKILTLMLLGLLFGLTSCQKDKDTQPNVSNDENHLVLNVNSNSKQLTAERMNYLYIPVFDTTYQGFFNNGKYLKSSNVIIPNPSHQFILIAEMSSPVRSNNRVLSATHVELLNNKAYVTYHFNEQSNSGFSGADLYEGQIDVLDVSDPYNPVLLQSATTDQADFNTLALDLNENAGERKVWMGATDFKSGGAIFQLTLENGEIPSSAVLSKTKTPPGKSVNSVVRSGDYLYATAGRTAGGVFGFNASSMALENKIEFTNAKYNAVSGTTAGSKHIVLKSGNNAELQIYEVSAPHNLLLTIPLGSIQPEDGKSVVWVKNNLAWVAMGYAGLKAFDINTGALVHTLSPSNMSPESVTNGVSVDDDYVYVANGSGGLYLCTITPGQQELNVVGVYQYGASANYVMAKNNYIFIANGREGVKILHKIFPGDYKIICDYDDNGVPQCLEPNLDPLCPTLLPTLALALPESQNAITNHPEYFANPNTEIKLIAPATIYVTFIDEGAGWKNSLGLYHYPTANPPASANEIKSTKTLVYPNASKVGGGGALLPGNYIHFVGTFPAGTTIGAFLVANAWKGVSPSYPTGLSEGYYTHYTRKELNPQNKQQSLLFYDASCDAIILSFEDIRIPSGDKDYNDCIFKVIVDPPTAIDVTQLNQL